MGKLEEAKKILAAVGYDKLNDLAGHVLLSLSNIGENKTWDKAQDETNTTRQIMDFMRDEYSLNYMPNTRETVRKNVLHYFLNYSIVEANKDEPTRAINSPKFCYSLTAEFLKLIRSFKTSQWEINLEKYLKNRVSLIDQYSKEREANRIPVKINGKDLTFSPGAHNQLQKLIIEEFGAIFAPGSEVLYVGDTDNKNLLKNEEKLRSLGIDMDEHSKLPDVILYSEEKSWIYFIESVTSVGPMNDKRIIEIGEMSKKCTVGKVYITAFLDTATFRKFASEIAWETEVWIAERPEHMIHYNGDRFFGPR